MTSTGIGLHINVRLALIIRFIGLTKRSTVYSLKIHLNYIEFKNHTDNHMVQL